MNSVRHRLPRAVLAGLKGCLVGIAAGLLLTGGPAAFAQTIFASLSGTVTDASGAVIPGAKVSIQNAATGAVRPAVTNGAGYFSATELPTGTYSVTAEAKGFKRWQGTGIVLNSDDNKTVNVSLAIGVTTETVEVSASATEVAVTDTGEKSSVITSEQLEHLSLVGRNATEYLKILPGASLSANGGVNKLGYSGEVIGINGFVVGNNAGGLSGVVINGQTGLGISITQDGQNVMDPGGPGSATPVNPNPDMISEVKVMTSNYGADNAKGPVVVNTISKGGGNEFHGDFHLYARNSAMNSEDAYNKAIENDPGNGFKAGELKVPSNYYYPGFTIGGPVLIPGTGFNRARKKVFFHESFENYRQLIDGGIDRAFVPTADMMKGDFMVTTAPGETFELFQLKDNSTVAMLTIPDGPPLPTRADNQPRLRSNGKTLAVVVSAPVLTQRSTVGGGVALSVPIDLAPIVQQLATHASAASLQGLDKPIPMGPIPPQGATELPIAVMKELGTTLKLVAAVPEIKDPTAHRLVLARLGCWGLGGFFALLYLVNLIRARRRG